MEIRGYRVEDKKALGHLLALAFGGTDAGGEEYLDPEKNRRLDPEQTYVAEEDGEPRATASVLPMQVFVDGVPAAMGGVAAVATHPAYRRKRLAGELLRAALRDMREQGVHLSMLDPFSHAFYRAHGYELAGEATRYDLKPGELSTSSGQRYLRAFREQDLPRMEALLEDEARRHPLCVRRGGERWRELLYPGGRRSTEPNKAGAEAVVYERDGEVEGYAMYRQRPAAAGEAARELQVPELVARTAGAREALVSFMASYDPLEWRVRHETPRGEPLHPFLKSSYVEARVEPGKMLRLVDVEGALSLLSRPVPEPLVLEVADDAIPENASPYTVGQGNVVRGAAAPERIGLDVRQLAQLYAGYLSVEQLHRHGLLAPGSERALELLDAMFPPGDPWVFPLDHF